MTSPDSGFRAEVKTLAASKDRADRLRAVQSLADTEDLWAAPVLDRLMRDADPDVGEAARLVVQSLFPDMRSAVRRAWFGAPSAPPPRTDSRATETPMTSAPSAGSMAPGVLARDRLAPPVAPIPAAALEALRGGGDVTGRYLVARVRGVLAKTPIDARAADVEAAVKELLARGEVTVDPATLARPFAGWRIAAVPPAAGDTTTGVTTLQEAPEATGPAEPLTGAPPVEHAPDGAGSLANDELDRAVLSVVRTHRSITEQQLLRTVAFMLDVSESESLTRAIALSVTRLAAERDIELSGEPDRPHGVWSAHARSDASSRPTQRAGRQQRRAASEAPLRRATRQTPPSAAGHPARDAQLEHGANPPVARPTRPDRDERASIVEAAIVDALGKAPRLLGRFLMVHVQQRLRRIIPAATLGEVQDAVNALERRGWLTVVRGGVQEFGGWFISRTPTPEVLPAPAAIGEATVESRSEPSSASVASRADSAAGMPPSREARKTLDGARSTVRDDRAADHDDALDRMVFIIVDTVGPLSGARLIALVVERLAFSDSHEAQAAVERSAMNLVAQGEIVVRADGERTFSGRLFDSRSVAPTTPASTRSPSGQLSQASSRQPAKAAARGAEIHPRTVVSVVRALGPILGRHLTAEIRSMPDQGAKRLPQADVQRAVTRLVETGVLEVNAPSRSKDFGQWEIRTKGSPSVRVRQRAGRPLRQIPASEVAQLLAQMRVPRDAQGRLDRAASVRAIASWYSCREFEHDLVDELLTTEWSECLN